MYFVKRILEMKNDALDGRGAHRDQEDAAGDQELVGASILTMPNNLPVQGSESPGGLSFLPLGFGEDLSAAALVRASLSHEGAHVVSSQNVISFAELVKFELQGKQKLIDDLLDELKTKTDAILICGNDIRQLREEKTSLEKLVQELRKELQMHQEQQNEITLRLLNPETQSSHEKELSLSSPRKHEQNLRKIAELLSDKKSSMDQLRESLDEKNRYLADSLSLRKNLELLEKKVNSQQQQIRASQSESQKIESYRLTIQTQEKLIAKLQSIMESKLKSRFAFLKEVDSPLPLPTIGDGKPTAKQYPLLDEPRNLQQPQTHRSESENPEDSESIQGQDKVLLEKVKALEEENVALKMRLQSFSRPSTSTSSGIPANFDTNGDLDRDFESIETQEPSNIKDIKNANSFIDRLKTENITKKFRIEALERQLEAASRESAREIARLRTKLFELEISIGLLREPLMSQQLEDDGNEKKSIGIESWTGENVSNPRKEPKSEATTERNEQTQQDSKEPSLKLVEIQEGEPDTQAILGNFVPRASPRNGSILSPSTRKQPLDAINIDLDENTAENDQNDRLDTTKKPILKEDIIERIIPLYDKDESEAEDSALSGIASLVFNYLNDHSSKQHIFSIVRVKIENFPVGATGASLFCRIRVFCDEKDTLWQIETPPVREAGSMILWDSDGPAKQASDKSFSISEADFAKCLRDKGGFNVAISLYRKTGQKEFLLGSGSSSLML